MMTLHSSAQNTGIGNRNVRDTHPGLISAVIRVRQCCAAAGVMGAMGCVGLWRDVLQLCKEIWQMTSIHHNPALSPAQPHTLASSTVTRWPQIMLHSQHIHQWEETLSYCLLGINKWLYFSVNSNRIKLSVGGAGRERPESHKSWQGWGVELVSNMW